MFLFYVLRFFKKRGHYSRGGHYLGKYGIYIYTLWDVKGTHNGENSILKKHCYVYLCKDISRYGQKTGQISSHFWNKKNRSSKEEFNHFLSIFNSASFITQYILCKNFFYKVQTCSSKSMEQTYVEQLYNLFFYF